MLLFTDVEYRHVRRLKSDKNYQIIRRYMVSRMPGLRDQFAPIEYVFLLLVMCFCNCIFGLLKQNHDGKREEFEVMQRWKNNIYFWYESCQLILFVVLKINNCIFWYESY